MDSTRLEEGLDAVNAFLNHLGIVHSDEVQTPAYWREIHREIGKVTGKPLTDTDFSDPMGEAVVDLFFTTPHIARKFLAADLPRLTQLLMTFETLAGLPESPENIAEIGGGPGIVSLWLAKKYPEARFTVYDQSENALNVGRTFAEALNITRVRYEKATYAALGETGTAGPFDLVLGLGALNLHVTGSEPHLCAGANPDTLASPHLANIRAFARACRALLAPHGVLHFSQGSFNDLGLLCLFNALRENGLGVDWRYTYSLGEGEGAGFSLKAMHLFLRPGRPTVFKDAHEDLTVFLYAAKMARFSDKIVLGHGDFEAWLGLVSDGTRLADIRSRQDDGRIERFTVYVKSGILGFFSSHSNGGRSGFIYNAASFESAVSRLHGIVSHYRKQHITLTRIDWHPYFEDLRKADGAHNP